MCTRWRAEGLSDKFRGDSVLSYTRNSSSLSAVPEAGGAAEAAAQPSAEHPAPLIEAEYAAVLRCEDGSEWLLGTGARGKVLRQDAWHGICVCARPLQRQHCACIMAATLAVSGTDSAAATAAARPSAA